MKFPTFWTRVQNPSGSVAARGWSEVSLDEATRNAQDRLQRILAALRNRSQFDLERYSYVIDHVICEEVIDRVVAEEQELAIVSRNAYGSLILNASQLMFVDIDFPKPKPVGWLSGWFSKKPTMPTSPQQETLENLRQWQGQHPNFTLRVYRTLAGVRVIVVNQVYERVDEQATDMMQELGSDPLYLKLCKSQACFRARLSPKPWRVGVGNPPKRFPFDATADRQQFELWNKTYVAATSRFKVCTYLETLGQAASHRNHLPLIQLHDELCCSDQDLPLA